MSSNQAAASEYKNAAKRLSLDGISKTFGANIALHTTTLDIQPGELIALLGPSGCGKTTTLRMIAGFEFPDTGAIRINGEDISHLPPNKRGLGMVFQNYSLFPHMTVAENIAFGLLMAGVDKATIASEVQRMLDMIRLPDYGPRKVSQLSGGQQQRVALARAIVTNPSVLLLDEPLGALDKNLREGMQTEIRKLQKDLGITSVMVTHDQEEAMTMSDRIVVMSAGRILQVGAPRDVYEMPRNRFVAEFLGTANILHGTVLAQGETWLQVQLQHSDTLVKVKRPNGTPSAGSPIELALRPEKISLHSTADGELSFSGTIIDHVFKGSLHTYTVHVDGLNQVLSVSHQSVSNYGSGHEIGAPIRLAFHADDIVALEEEEQTT